MNTQQLNQQGFIYNGHTKKIEPYTYAQYLREYGADETTTPKGVAPRLHIREKTGVLFKNIHSQECITETEYNLLSEDEQAHYNYFGEHTIAWELWTWGPGGNHPRPIDAYNDEEVATNELYLRFEHYVLEKNWDAPPFLNTIQATLQYIADILQRRIEVIQRYFQWKGIAENWA